MMIMLLNPETMLQVFEAIRTSKPLASHHPILAFEVVQVRCAMYPALPPGYRELHVLKEFLTEMLLPCLYPPPHDSLYPGLQWDFRCDNPLVESCSLLYYRYLRPEFGLTMQAIAMTVGSTTRTLQRRQHDGLQYLIMQLIQMEMQTREIVYV